MLILRSDFIKDLSAHSVSKNYLIVMSTFFLHIVTRQEQGLYNNSE
jgi:hypothetical protein